MGRLISNELPIDLEVISFRDLSRDSERKIICNKNIKYFRSLTQGGIYLVKAIVKLAKDGISVARSSCLGNLFL